jgi:transcriptional regulator of NAD metabolism
LQKLQKIENKIVSTNKEYNYQDVYSNDARKLQCPYGSPFGSEIDEAE